MYKSFITKGDIMQQSLCCILGRVENRKSWKITKPQVDPIDAHKNETVCMI